MFLRAEKRAGPDTATGATDFIFPRSDTESLPYRFGRGICLLQSTPRFPLSKLKPQAHRIKQDDPLHIENRSSYQNRSRPIPIRSDAARKRLVPRIQSYSLGYKSTRSHCFCKELRNCGTKYQLLTILAATQYWPGEARCACHFGTLQWSKQRDEIDFDADVARQARDFDGRARRRMRPEIMCVDFIHRGKVIHVGKKDRGLYDPLD
jgi:hypothetical protein